MWKMRTSTHIDQVSASVNCRVANVFFFDQTLFKRIMLEHVDELLLCDIKSLERPLFFHHLVVKLLKLGHICFRTNRIVAHPHIVVKSVFDVGTVAESTTKVSLHTLTQNVSTKEESRITSNRGMVYLECQ